MKIAIVGSAPRKDKSFGGFPPQHRQWIGQLMHALFFHSAGTVEIVSGDAEGPDAWAIEAADMLGITRHKHIADWTKHGKPAGPIRNTEIAKECDGLIAFWDCESRGTQDVIKKAIRARKPVWIVGPSAPFDADRIGESIVKNVAFFHGK